jgi:hypothetical protein
MKRIVAAALGLMVLGTCLYARDRGIRRWDRFGGPGGDRPSVAERISLTGTLGLRRGIITLESGERIWYVPGLERYAGFIAGLKEGATVTLEGWEVKTFRASENGGVLRAAKLTVDGRDYELERPEPKKAREWLPPPDRRHRGPPSPYFRDSPMGVPGGKWGRCHTW